MRSVWTRLELWSLRFTATFVMLALAAGLLFSIAMIPLFFYGVYRGWVQADIKEFICGNIVCK